MDAVRNMYQDARGYQTLIVDTLDALEPMLLEHVCIAHNWKNIEQPSYGKGFVIADQEWQRFLRGVTALRDKWDMTIVLVAHSEITRIDDPRAPSGWETGQTWTPDPTSPPGRLAALADRLRAYAIAPPGERPKLRDRLLKEAASLQSDLDQRHRLGERAPS